MSTQSAWIIGIGLVVILLFAGALMVARRRGHKLRRPGRRADGVTTQPLRVEDQPAAKTARPRTGLVELPDAPAALPAREISKETTWLMLLPDGTHVKLSPGIYGMSGARTRFHTFHWGGGVFSGYKFDAGWYRAPFWMWTLVRPNYHYQPGPAGRHLPGFWTIPDAEGLNFTANGLVVKIADTAVPTPVDDGTTEANGIGGVALLDREVSDTDDRQATDGHDDSGGTTDSDPPPAA